ncbi:MAG TPA: Plug domain-containing protein, partial [Novosphingobium sp.]
MTFAFYRRTLRFAAASAAVLAIASAGQAFAADAGSADADALVDVADAGTGGDAIVVTARRREEKAQEVPIAISVVSGEDLAKTGNFTMTQIQYQVPSLQVISLNPRNSNINIRGLGSNSSIALDGLESGFGFYVDGVYYARPGQAQFDLVDIQRVEVLKGPQ